MDGGGSSGSHSPRARRLLASRCRTRGEGRWNTQPRASERSFGLGSPHSGSMVGVGARKGSTERKPSSRSDDTVQRRRLKKLDKRSRRPLQDNRRTDQTRDKPPRGWSMCGMMGQPVDGTRIIPCKVPLSEKYHISPKQRFTPATFIAAQVEMLV